MEKKYIQSIIRACDILDYIATHPKARLNEIATACGLAKTTAHGIISTLEYKKMIEKDGMANYSLGIKNYTYGRVYERNFNLVKIVRPYLEQLVAKYNESVHLGIEENDEVLYIDRVNSTHALRMDSNIGGHDLLYCTAIGKVILSQRSEESIDAYIDKTQLTKMSKNTFTEAKALKEELKKIRMNGYAVDDEELENDLICIASPIYGQGFKAVISISGLKNRIDDKIFESMKQDILTISRSISNLLSN